LHFYSFIQYLHYFFEAKNEHAIQAPFLYNFYLKVIKNKQQQVEFKAIELLRAKLLKDRSPIANSDFGAGTRTNIKFKSVKNLAHTSLSSPKKAQLLFRIIQYLACNSILEIGSSLGISTAYLASAGEQTTVYSLEGNVDLLMHAKNTVAALNLKNTQFVEGNFNSTLPALLQNLQQPLAFVFLDGNHKYAATTQYFYLLLPHLHLDAVLVLDDIYWSGEMTEAWREIIAHPKSRLTIDLFSCGIVLFSNKFSKQHFRLRF